MLGERGDCRDTFQEPTRLLVSSKVAESAFLAIPMMHATDVTCKILEDRTVLACRTVASGRHQYDSHAEKNFRSNTGF